MTTVAACAVLAVMELDAVLVAQTLISRPLAVGAVLGALTGWPEPGLLYGAVFEILALSDLPVGGCLTWSAPVAAGVAVLLTHAGASTGTCFVGALAAGVLHSRAEGFERRLRAASGDALARGVEAGERSLGAALGLSVAVHAAMTFALAVFVVGLLGAADRRWWTSVPEILRAGAAFAATVSPWVALSGVAAWGLKRA